MESEFIFVSFCFRQVPMLLCVIVYVPSRPPPIFLNKKTGAKFLSVCSWWEMLGDRVGRACFQRAEERIWFVCAPS